MKNYTKFFNVVSLAVLICMLQNLVIGQTYTYPKARKTDQVDDFYGTKFMIRIVGWKILIPAESREWINAQIKLQDAYLSQIPQRQQIKER